MKLLKLAAQSAWSRRVSLMLAMFSIAISILLLLGVDAVRKEAKHTFLNTLSGTDLIVGARSGPENLLLYSVFRIGNATNNISYQTYEDIAAMPEVAWTVPISLGDSHRGFRVMGTNGDYFEFYRYGRKQPLRFSAGEPFADVYEAVLGADVARKLDYQLGDSIVLAHGIGDNTLASHDDKPFKVIGILEKTGTPIDRTVHVSLEGIEAIHIDWQSGTRSPLKISAEQAKKMNLQPELITAFMLGLNNRAQTFQVQRRINEYREEPLLAILPGATLASLWRTVGNFEKVLLAVSTLVLIAGLIGLLTTLLTTLNERRREMAVLRAVGAHAYHVMLLFILEAVMVVIGGCLLGIAFLYVALFALQPIAADLYGVHISIRPLDQAQWLMLAAALILGLLFSLVPGYIAYKRSLQDGLTVKI